MISKSLIKWKSWMINKKEESMTRQIYFSTTFFSFLRDLSKNNNKEWFHDNKTRYQNDVRDPLLAFISDISSPLQRISRHIIADPRPVGGSMFRIYRDIRFSKVKTPYKTNAGAQFRHEAGKDVHAPGFYLHLEPDHVFVGAGVWRPDTKTLNKIRDAIVKESRQWSTVIKGLNQKSICTYNENNLKRAPKGYDPNHPFIEDLKRKDFAVMQEFTESDAHSDKFMNIVLDSYKNSAKYMKFLTKALELPF
ncbi:MAG: hypothetical protein OMM_03057 [Candidatus Magnetoglobus multicellularis str. Araruama]|uniref:TIGR02453 family protein n=1 Tax=Candidatus Magnetoglobus multicellularis str. Araruama TaxID=890399 RepID=A0A1V1P7C1_9BACT|nr:MAG: hypothetical protein OMM_03057 [Candidatus Magnetoglobus multicellularis str. Araruama]